MARLQTILDTIVETKKTEVIVARHQPVSFTRPAHPVPTFRSAISRSGIQIIAEIKKASPSRGILIEDFHPAELAKAYQAGGAAAFSVLTDETYFKGHLTHLHDVAQLGLAPAIRKDFIIDPVQIEQAYQAGASAILLIAAILDDPALHSLYKIATNLRLDVLVEVHTVDELKRVLHLDNPIIGVNNRNLHSFHVDLQTALDMAPLIPAELIKVTESGIFTRKDMLRMEDAGFHAALIGESLVTSGHPQQKLRELLGQD
ncbi:MAG: indole-3-glycerol phosphate synthase TrpC [Bacteroidetes bacterium]|nr:indole-3-glycerol phosphate synthase TrpC [Bacteroidota bacterium]